MQCSYSLLEPTAGKEAVTRKRKSFLFETPCSNNNDCTPYVITLQRGVYQFEAWGSAGASFDSKSQPGLGGYTSGQLYLSSPETTFYLYIGNKGGFNASPAPIRSGRGGGATDIRYKGSSWNDFESLKSRIMVAAGGGGSEWQASIGGFGGGLQGKIGTGSYNTDSVETNMSIIAKGGSQLPSTDPVTYAYVSSIIFPYYKIVPIYPGKFGMAFINDSTDAGGVGGGGYYAGYSVDYSGGGGGGSSFISGHDGCIAILENSTDIDDIHPSNNSLHFSGYVFQSTKMIDGSQPMPHFKSSTPTIGNSQEGAIRITLLSEFQTCQCISSLIRFHLAYIYLFILIK